MPGKRNSQNPDPPILRTIVYTWPKIRNPDKSFRVAIIGYGDSGPDSACGYALNKLPLYVTVSNPSTTFIACDALNIPLSRSKNMLLVSKSSFGASYSPITIRICLRFALRGQLRGPGFTHTPLEHFCDSVSHVRGISVWDFTASSIHEREKRRIYDPCILHSSSTHFCKDRAFGALNNQIRSSPFRGAILAKAYSTNQSKTNAGASTKKPTPKELRTHIEAFFAQYPEFEYDPTKPCLDELKRLRESKGWDKKSDEFKQARKGMNEALTEQFNAIYGKDPDDIAAWRNLCSVLNLADIPTEISACKKLIKSLYINIVDLVDQPVTNVRVGYFHTEGELARYTWEHEKFYSLQAAKAGALLKRLLRFIEQPRRKGRSNPKLRKA